MKLIFPGTSSGETSVNYFHSSLLLNNSILIDTGDGISKALKSLNFNLNDLNTIIITHLHPDHFSGLTSLINQMKLSKRISPLTIFVHENILELCKNFLRSCYLFEEKFPFKLNWKSFVFDNEYLLDEDLTFSPVKNNHISNKYKVDFPEKYFVSVSLNFQITDKNIFYTSDLKDISDFDYFDLRNTDFLISEISHFNIDELLARLKNLPIKKLILTHISDQLREELKSQISELNCDSPFEIILAYDGLELEF